MGGAPEKALTDRRVLVAEDEYFIARDLGRALHALGAEVVGPVPSVDAVQAILAAGEHLDAAILDINLDGGWIFSALADLVARGIPVVLATGYEDDALPAEYRHVPRWQKPFDPSALAEALPGLLRDR